MAFWKKWKRDVRRVKHEIDSKLDPSEQERVLETAFRELTTAVSRLRSTMEFRVTVFLQDLKKWRTMTATEAPNRPQSIPGDHQEAKDYSRKGWTGIIIESSVGAWAAEKMWGQPWYIGVVFAVIASLFAYILILAAMRAAENLRESLWLTRRFVYRPSLFLFIPSFAIFLGTRVVSGDIAIALEPVFQISLWSTTISLLTLVGSLFTMAWILDWSTRQSSEYNRLEEECDARATLLDTVRLRLADIGSLPVPQPEASTGGTDHA